MIFHDKTFPSTRDAHAGFATGSGSIGRSGVGFVTFPVYVIHMASQPKRWNGLMERLSCFPSLNPVLVEAVDGNSIPEIERQANTHWSYSFRTGLPGMTPGEFGCGMSHRKTYGKLLDSKHKWACILEDDVLLSDNLEDAINAAFPLLETERPTIVLLSANLIGSAIPAICRGRFSFHKLASGGGAYGYLINRSAACRLLKFDFPFRTPCDWWRQKLKWGIRIFFIVPHVASYAEDRSDSLLEGPRKALWEARAHSRQSLGMRLGVLLFREIPSFWWRLLYRFHHVVLFPKQW